MGTTSRHGVAGPRRPRPEPQVLDDLRDLIERGRPQTGQGDHGRSPAGTSQRRTSEEQRIGAAGGEAPLTSEQRASIVRLLTRERRAREELHHGRCAGSVVEIADLAVLLGYRVVRHRHGDTPAARLQAQQDLVDLAGLLLVVPSDDRHTRAGRVWQMYRYARSRRVQTLIVWPSGVVVDRAPLREGRRLCR